MWHIFQSKYYKNFVKFYHGMGQYKRFRANYLFFLHYSEYIIFLAQSTQL